MDSVASLCSLLQTQLLSISLLQIVTKHHPHISKPSARTRADRLNEAGENRRNAEYQ